MDAMISVCKVAWDFPRKKTTYVDKQCHVNN